MEIFNFDDMLHGNTFPHPSQNLEEQLLARRATELSSPLRELNYRSPLKSAQRIDANIDEKTTNQSYDSTVCGLLTTKLDKFRNQSIIKNLYNENPNYKTNQLFVDSFLVINALKGLSNLAMASINEDEYGILQRTLPDIINTFVSLQKILERCSPTNKYKNISFKLLQNSNVNKIDLYMQKLKFILNESIHKITYTFGSSLK